MSGETPCHVFWDGRHCDHWYDGGACHFCRDPADPAATADYDETPESTTMKDGS